MSLLTNPVRVNAAGGWRFERPCMQSPQRPEQSGSESADKVLRRMGMILSVVGAILIAVGLVLGLYDVRDDLQARCVLTLILGTALLVSGLYIWHTAQKSR